MAATLSRDPVFAKIRPVDVLVVGQHRLGRLDLDLYIRATQLP